MSESFQRLLDEARTRPAYQETEEQAQRAAAARASGPGVDGAELHAQLLAVGAWAEARGFDPTLTLGELLELARPRVEAASEG